MQNPPSWASLSRPAPLSGIKVLDLSRVLAGPWASQTLADMGAEVIKIERPKIGDDTRQWGPPFLRDQQGQTTAESAYFLCTNRNKRSLTVDITTAKGQEIIRQLAQQSDIFLENFKVGGLASYHLDYPSLSAINRQLIYCSITGFGQTGPLAERAGYDAMIQAMGGLMSLSGRGAGEEGEGPMKAGVAIVDIMTGLYATIAVLAAIRERAVSGLGQFIDLALLDVQVATLANQAANYLIGDIVPQRVGNSHPNIVPYQDFPTADGDIYLAIGNDSQFQKFCHLIDNADWLDDPRFATNAKRVVHRQTLIPLLRQVMVRKSTQTWINLLEKAGIPCGPINRLDQVFADPQVQARGLHIKMPHRLAGEVSLVANPIRFSDSPLSYAIAPPLLGEHSEEILQSRLHYSAETIAQLRQEGII